jgi:NAD(P)-dependent dehydrogenase (short-subunit alcohol dehydrogenase family)
MRTALITGIGGQDGSYLAEFLLKQGYAVHGLVRRSSNLNRERIDGLRGLAVERGMPFELHYGNLISRRRSRGRPAYCSVFRRMKNQLWANTGAIAVIPRPGFLQAVRRT